MCVIHSDEEIANSINTAVNCFNFLEEEVTAFLCLLGIFI